MKSESCAWPAIALLLFTVAGRPQCVHAHHSFAMFDKDRLVTLQGTVRKVEYTNPHVFLFVEVPAQKGAQQWAIECGSINYVSRIGWKVNTVKVGDRVKVTVNPLRNGKPGGSIKTLTLSNGTVIEG